MRINNYSRYISKKIILCCSESTSLLKAFRGIPLYNSLFISFEIFLIYHLKHLFPLEDAVKLLYAALHLV